MKKDNLFYKITKNQEFRGYLLSYISLLLTIFFLIYNFYIGVKYNLIWNKSITFYYLMLLLIRFIILINEKRFTKLTFDERTTKRINLIKIINILFIILDLTLIVPISLMVLGKKNVNIGVIPAIAIATYTAYKVVVAIVSFNKTKKINNILFHVLKTINLKEAIVSIITLQNILIMTFSNGESMSELTSYTSAGLFLLLIFVSIYQIIKIRLIKIV